jgi:RND family efflux transporter MFP subunit
VDNRVTEAALTRVTLTPEAERRLGIELAEVREGRAGDSMSVAGEVVPIPGKSLMVNAPAAGTIALAGDTVITAGQIVAKGQPVLRLTPVVGVQPDLKSAYEADLQAAKARLDAATQQLERSRQLLRDMAGSQRDVEAASREFAQAKAAHDAMVTRLGRLSVNPLEADFTLTIASPESGVIRSLAVGAGQTVSAGAPLFEVADLTRVWLRVPVYSGDLAATSLQSTIRVRDASGAGPVRQAVRVSGPPTADPLAGTTDLYFEIANSNGQLRPGQRLVVVLPSRSGTRNSLSVPAAAILYDIHGGTWVYVNEQPHIYRRQRVELIETQAGSAFLSRGLQNGDKVVTAGAAELFGTEFGAGH